MDTRVQSTQDVDDDVVIAGAGPTGLTREAEVPA